LIKSNVFILNRCAALLISLLVGLIPFLSGCDLPQVKAEDRLFLPIALEFLGEYQLPKTDFEGVPVGGISAIAYDRSRDRLYALSDDHGAVGPNRFYTLKLNLDRSDRNQPTLTNLEVESVTVLKAEDGSPYSANHLDPEGIALSPRNTVFISSEGFASTDIPPAVEEFDLTSGQWIQALPIPDRYIPGEVETEAGNTEKGIFNNLGFEALTVNPVGMASPMVEPFRLFVATESALAQDLDPTGSDPSVRTRFLHYLVGEDQITLISEHYYPLTPDPLGTVLNGLTELVVLDQGGHFLALERTFGLQGFNASLYQLATGGATDTSGLFSLKGDLSGTQPIRKQLLLNLQDLGITLDNLEGMALGPRLPDGSQSLILVSDDNFRDDQVTQFLLFKLQA
jgi:hypothetical protein